MSAFHQAPLSPTYGSTQDYSTPASLKRGRSMFDFDAQDSRDFLYTMPEELPRPVSPLPPLTLSPVVEEKKKNRRAFGRGARDKRTLHAALSERVSDKLALPADELEAFHDLKTFETWVPVSGVDLMDLCIPGDWVMFSKPKYQDRADSGRKRYTAKVAGKTENSLSFETISTKDKVPDYQWTFKWAEDGSEADVEAAITGNSKRRYYMRIPSTKSVAPRSRPSAQAKKKRKTEFFTCTNCGVVNGNEHEQGEVSQ